MKGLPLLFAFALFLSANTAIADSAPTQSEVVVSMDGKSYTVGDLNAYLQEVGGFTEGGDSKFLKLKRLVVEMIKTDLLAAKAKKKISINRIDSRRRENSDG
ncbi:MAG: hypothetical protein R3A47_03345 [Polyangiales bacterium]